jgi:hypothetical protein
MYASPFQDEGHIQPTAQWTEEETKQAIKLLPAGKAAGPDGIFAESLKYGGRAARNITQRVLNAIANAGYIPKSLNTASIYLIPKDKTKPQDPSKYRPISLTNTWLKILDRK